MNFFMGHFKFLKPFSMPKFAGFKNIYMSICKKKLAKIAFVPLTSIRVGGVNCPAKNVSFFMCSLRLPEA